jgi:hypothetical protein
VKESIQNNKKETTTGGPIRVHAKPRPFPGIPLFFKANMIFGTKRMLYDRPRSEEVYAEPLVHALEKSSHLTIQACIGKRYIASSS